MSVIFILIPLSIVLASLFLAGYIWAVRSGQYEDTCTPALRLLTEDGGMGPDGKEPFLQKDSPLESQDRTISTPKPNHPR